MAIVDCLTTTSYSLWNTEIIFILAKQLSFLRSSVSLQHKLGHNCATLCSWPPSARETATGFDTHAENNGG